MSLVKSPSNSKSSATLIASGGRPSALFGAGPSKMTEAVKLYSTSSPTDVPRIPVVAAGNFTAIAALLKRATCLETKRNTPIFMLVVNRAVFPDPNHRQIRRSA